MTRPQEEAPVKGRDEGPAFADRTQHYPDCPRCGGTTESRREPEGSTHYARLTCRRCGHFLRWLPHPRMPTEADVERLFSALVQARKRHDWKALRGLQAALRGHGWTITATAPAGQGGRRS